MFSGLLIFAAAGCGLKFLSIVFAASLISKNRVLRMLAAAGMYIPASPVFLCILYYTYACIYSGLNVPITAVVILLISFLIMILSFVIATWKTSGSAGKLAVMFMLWTAGDVPLIIALFGTILGILGRNV